MDVHEGEVVVVLGPSGSGKSTFIRTINQLEKHDEGILESFQVRSKRFDNEYEDYAKKLDDEID